MRDPIQDETAADERLAKLRRMLERNRPYRDAEITPASSDASFRRYFRVRTAAGSWVAMDAPPPMENCRPFIEIAGYLADMGLNAPRVLETNLDDGFLVLTDLGSRQYLAELQEHPEHAESLYRDALAALVTMQRAGRPFQRKLPPYDEKLLRFELSLFRDWLCGRHLGIEFDARLEREWQRTCDSLVANALRQARVFVHRDYHSRNLMVTDENNPGILDFQDAVEGPFTYDLVSLLKDCYVRWPKERVLGWAIGFFEATDASVHGGMSAAGFLRAFELMGVQRHLKAAGIFARLNHRDGKPGYMLDIPRTLGYIVELAGDHTELAALVTLIEERVLPGLEAAA
ncbi:MAG: phosphotransferase [Gammaproteobacteria bacterium]|nr:phosphotransferase [Gammaproteobacteria bacterium]MDH4254433.1 phosphotransferase [Gammaproteobacteria bacterium]MDH5311094.1 phosphotransferase [Gammaproteobacteria bacterium]